MPEQRQMRVRYNLCVVLICIMQLSENCYFLFGCNRSEKHCVMMSAIVNRYSSPTRVGGISDACGA